MQKVDGKTVRVIIKSARVHLSNRRPASMIAMIVVGGVLIPVYALWDFKYAKFPVIPRRYAVNRSVVLASAIGAFDFVRIFTQRHLQHFSYTQCRFRFTYLSLTCTLS